MIVDLNILSKVAEPCPACKQHSLCCKKINPSKGLASSGDVPADVVARLGLIYGPMVFLIWMGVIVSLSR